MIGSGLKKLAAEYGMKVGHGIAYGNMGGFAASMSEGAGFKQVTFITKFTDPDKKEGFMQSINSVNINREFRVKDFAVSPTMIRIVFLDNPGTMDKLRAFVGWVIQLLQHFGATGINVCPECGGEIVSGRWVMIGGVAYYMHDGCAQKAARDIDGENTQRRENDNGSYVTGLVGALIGAALGSVVWALVYKGGYVASLVGLLIGWLAGKGYDLLKGKQDKVKVAILIVAIILGVVAGTFAGLILGVQDKLSQDYYMDYTLSESAELVMDYLSTDSEGQGDFIKDIMMGLLFAGLGVFALLKNTGAAVADAKITYLE